MVEGIRKRLMWRSKHTAIHTHGTDTNEAVRDIVRRWREQAGGGPRWVLVSKLLDELEQAVSVHTVET
jgi:hypothetical protein